MTSAQTVAYGPGEAKTGSRKLTSMAGTTPRSWGGRDHSALAAYPRTTEPHPVSDAEAGGRRSGPKPAAARGRRMPERDDLPLHDYDHLPVGSLTSRIRTLGAGRAADPPQLRAVARQPHPGGGRHGEPADLAEGGRPALRRRPRAATPEAAPAAGRRVEGVRGDVRPAGQPAVPRRPDQPGPAEVATLVPSGGRRPPRRHVEGAQRRPGTAVGRGVVRRTTVPSLTC